MPSAPQECHVARCFAPRGGASAGGDAARRAWVVALRRHVVHRIVALRSHVVHRAVRVCGLTGAWIGLCAWFTDKMTFSGFAYP